MKRVKLAVAMIAAAVPAGAVAQQPGEAVLYSSTNFRGYAYRMSGATRPIDPAFVAKSIKIPEGQSWELCSGNTFTDCKQFSGSDNSTIISVRSARPVAPVLTETQVNATIAAGGQASLRGYSSEFFIVPGDNGNRIEVAGGTAEAMTKAAVEFCRAKGWRNSPYARLQRLEGRHFLADVLCTDSD
ncbi:hypothetical protein H8M03_04565 [Sphingomonas sabuli]|uniref:Beta/gamma crystallin 'Greek key' domain-containing protein n=1 Tax=Sphingomonas sabuli TaxID=2764186 RepID=A0A7G9L4Q6_9SPHN|nr:hypothetical protein [Sphingomonas sabuli]QNM83605.1 hypothetical protein H8M03_04565 [Sphingomonas sabuli]